MSAVIGSSQLSKGVNAEVNAGQSGINELNNATVAAQNNEANAVTGANNTLGQVAGAETNNLNPYLDAGTQGITSLASMLQPGGALTQQFSFNPSNLTSDPGYQFQLNQGDQAATRSAAAAGGANSGNLDTALSQYNQGLAGTTFNNAYNRALTTFQTNRQNTLQPLSTLINAGQTATGQFDQAAQNYGNTTSANTIGGATYEGNAGLSNASQVSKLLVGIGNAQAAGSIGQGNIWGNLAGGTGFDGNGQLVTNAVSAGG